MFGSRNRCALSKQNGRDWWKRLYGIFYQIYLSDIKENKVSLIEDALAEYRVREYLEFLENSQKESPLLLNKKININLDQKLMKSSLLKEIVNGNLEEKIVKTSSGYIILEANSEIFKEKKIVAGNK